jgi:hypothetical protein
MIDAPSSPIWPPTARTSNVPGYLSYSAAARVKFGASRRPSGPLQEFSENLIGESTFLDERMETFGDVGDGLE